MLSPFSIQCCQSDYVWADLEKELPGMGVGVGVCCRSWAGGLALWIRVGAGAGFRVGTSVSVRVCLRVVLS